MARLNLFLRIVGGIGLASWTIARASGGIGREAIEGNALARTRFANALDTYMWRPLPVLAALAALVGLVAGTVAARLLDLYHAELAIEPTLVRSLCRDVIPVIFGVFAAGRVSVELAARLAGTSLAREIEALEALGHDPVRHLLSPALAAVVAAVPVHMLVGAICAILATGFVLDQTASTPFATFLRLTIDDGAARALAIGMAKALLFALIAFGVGASIGSGGARGAGEIGARATSAFTTGLLIIFAAAALWTILG